MKHILGKDIRNGYSNNFTLNYKTPLLLTFLLFISAFSFGATLNSSSTDKASNGTPIPMCQDVVVDTNGNCDDIAVPATDFDNGSTDPDMDPLTFSVSPQGPYASGSTLVTLTVDDGNSSSTCTATVTVEDNEAPTITCPMDITVDTSEPQNYSPISGGRSIPGPGGPQGPSSIFGGGITFGTISNSCSATVFALGSATVTDNCVTITPTNDAPFSYNLGSNTVTWTADDGNGQSVTCTQTVTVVDNEAPTISCPMDVTVDTDAGACSATGVALGSATAMDNCATITLTNDALASYSEGSNTVTWTADDGNGQSTCTQTVTVEDNEAPTAICQDLTLQLDANGNASITTADIDNGSSDACSFSLSASQTSFDCTNVATNSVTLTVTDTNANVSTCTATVTVEDNVLPIAVCQAHTVQLDTSGNASITTADIDNGSSDACGPLTLTASQTAFDCSEVGANTVTLVVIDDNNNVLSLIHI